MENDMLINAAVKVEDILKVFDGHCQCGHGESCDYCNHSSDFWRLRERFRQLAREFRGIREKPWTMEDYRNHLVYTTSPDSEQMIKMKSCAKALGAGFRQSIIGIPT